MMNPLGLKLKRARSTSASCSGPRASRTSKQLKYHDYRSRIGGDRPLMVSVRDLRPKIRATFGLPPNRVGCYLPVTCPADSAAEVITL